MPLPFSFSGRVDVGPQHDAKGAALKLERGLEILKAKRIDHTGLRIHFTTGFARLVLSTNLLAPISSGELLIQPKSGGLVVVYNVRFTHMLVGASVMVFFFFGPFVLSAPNMSSAQAVALLVGAWMWLFGGNVVLALIRFPRWIRRTLGTHHN